MLTLLFRTALVSALLLLTSQSSLAQQADFYRVEAAVANQSESERANAAKIAFPDVLLKSTANPDILNQPQVKQALPLAINYVASFSYLAENRVVLNFSPQSIRGLVQQAGGAGAEVVSNTSLMVAQVSSFSELKQLQQILKVQANLRKAELIEVKGDKVLFNLQLNASLEQVKASLAASNKLSCVQNNVAGLDCRWIR